MMEHSKPLKDLQKAFPLRYQQGEFNMTSDSRHFVTSAQAAKQDYHPCFYGHRLRGAWRDLSAWKLDNHPTSDPVELYKRQHLLPPEYVLSSEGSQALSVEDLQEEDIYLPLFQGAMLYGYSHNAARYKHGSGHRSSWERHNPFAPLQPQFFVPSTTYQAWSKTCVGPRIAFRALSNATNERTFVVSCLNTQPCGNSIGLLHAFELDWPTPALLAQTALMGSFAYDWLLRHRLVGTNLNAFLLEETRLPEIPPHIAEMLGLLLGMLCFAGYAQAPFWLRWRQHAPEQAQQLSPPFLYALASQTRQKLHCVLDAASAVLFGLDKQELQWILRDCHHPISKSSDARFTRKLDPKGFWRVQKHSPPQERQTTQIFIIFESIKERDLHSFLQNFFKEECFFSYDHFLDRRSREIGPTFAENFFVPPETIWRHCEEHALRLRKINTNCPV
ncbi:MAG: hypothetical protein H6728_15075 [Myxococcales bacterium]|nr:hypothetical protein [Myxococcales bacterium]